MPTLPLKPSKASGASSERQESANQVKSLEDEKRKLGCNSSAQQFRLLNDKDIRCFLLFRRITEFHEKSFNDHPQVSAGGYSCVSNECTQKDRFLLFN